MSNLSSARVLLVDDDATVCSTFAAALELDGHLVAVAPTGVQALRLAESLRPEWIIVDYRLPDMSGVDVMRELTTPLNSLVNFVVISGFLTTAVTVEAMRLGAVDVLEKPVLIEDIATLITKHKDGTRRWNNSRTVDAFDVEGQPHGGSIANRWASLVFSACRHHQDVKTLAEWARLVGVSYSSLCETCRLVGVRPHDARDFMRGLRAVIAASRESCAPDILLDIRDRRTLQIFMCAAGRGFTSHGNVEEFVAGQTFISLDNPALRILLHWFST